MFPRAVPVLAILAAAGCGGQDESDDRSAATPAPKPATRLGTRCCYEAGAKDVGGTDIISSGTTKTLVDLKAGEYVFFCSVGRHAEDGMQGRLTVAGR